MKRFFFVVLIFFATASALQASRRAIAPERSAMVGVFLGYTTSQDLIRLELREDGTGRLVRISGFVESYRKVHKISKWTWDRAHWKLDLSIQPAGEASTEQTFVKVRYANARSIGITVGGKSQNSKWSRDADLINEKRFIQQWDAAKKD